MFVQNVHNFRDECLKDETRAPVEHVALFDEAQRAWDLQQTANFMKRKKKRPGFNQSEPEFLISTRTGTRTGPLLCAWWAAARR